MLQNKLKNQKGVSIFLVLVIMTIFLAAVLGLSTILFSQIGMVREMGYSVVAFYAADSGIENILYKDFVECIQSSCNLSYCIAGCSTGLSSPSSFNETLNNGALTTSTFSIIGSTRNASSTGEFQGVRRSIEIKY